jgi:hypothetical protein
MDFQKDHDEEGGFFLRLDSYEEWFRLARTTQVPLSIGKLILARKIYPLHNSVPNDYPQLVPVSGFEARRIAKTIVRAKSSISPDMAQAAGNFLARR